LPRTRIVIVQVKSDKKQQKGKDSASEEDEEEEKSDMTDKMPSVGICQNSASMVTLLEKYLIQKSSTAHHHHMQSF